MKCPACGGELSQRPVGDITVDLCATGCGGLWFDHRELDGLKQPTAEVADELLTAGPAAAGDVDLDSRRRCPCCESTVMMRHFFSPRREVEIDDCPRCGGIWLDTGELSWIRTLVEEKGETDDDGSAPESRKASRVDEWRRKETLRKAHRLAGLMFRYTF